MSFISSSCRLSLFLNCYISSFTFFNYLLKIWPPCSLGLFYIASCLTSSISFLSCLAVFFISSYFSSWLYSILFIFRSVISFCCSKYLIFSYKTSILESWFFCIRSTLCRIFSSTRWTALVWLWSVLSHYSIAVIEFLWFSSWKLMFLRIFYFWFSIPSIFSSTSENLECD